METPLHTLAQETKQAVKDAAAKYWAAVDNLQNNYLVRGTELALADLKRRSPQFDVGCTLDFWGTFLVVVDYSICLLEEDEYGQYSVVLNVKVETGKIMEVILLPEMISVIAEEPETL